MSKHQRKALGWIVQDAVEKFVAERRRLVPREADDIEGDIESLLPLLKQEDRYVMKALLEGGFNQPVQHELKIAA